MEFNSFGPAVGRLGSDSSRGGGQTPPKSKQGGWAPLTLTTGWRIVAPYSERTVKISNFWKSKMAAATILKIIKIAIFPQQFDRSLRNSAHWCKMGLLTSTIVKEFEFHKSKMAVGRDFENRKIAISLQSCDQAHYTDTTATRQATGPHYISKCSEVSHHRKVVSCGCGVCVVCLVFGRRLALVGLYICTLRPHNATLLFLE